MDGFRWDMTLTAMVPVALLLVLSLVLLGNKLSVDMRRRVELGLALGFYPPFAGFFIWKAVGAGQTADWLTCAGWALFALFIASNGVRVVRRRLIVSTGKAASS